MGNLLYSRPLMDRLIPILEYLMLDLFLSGGKIFKFYEKLYIYRFDTVYR